MDRFLECLLMNERRQGDGVLSLANGDLLYCYGMGKDMLYCRRTKANGRTQDFGRQCQAWTLLHGFVLCKR